MLKEIEVLLDISIQNKYFQWYIEICGRALARANSKKKAKVLFGYIESHHVLPKSFGYDLNFLVHLTAREHFICHRLLLKFLIVPLFRKKMAYALCHMISSKRYGSKQYEQFQTQLQPLISGTNNSHYGKEHTDEWKLNASIRTTGINNPNYGKPSPTKGKKRIYKHSESTIEKLKYIQSNRSTETQAKMNDSLKGRNTWNKGIKPPRKYCDICNKDVDIRNFARWHSH